MKNYALALIFCSLFWSCTKDTSVNSSSQKDNIESKIDSILSRMTLEEKIGQTAHVENPVELKNYLQN